MKTFALIGAAGFIAPRHMKAMRETNNELVAALDKFDSVGIIDSYFPQADFFTEFERFDRHLEKRRRKTGQPVDYISICTPNYLHDSHIRFGLRHHADVICEKPVVLNPWNIDALQEIESETGKRVYNILQLRHHPKIISLKQKIDQEPSTKKRQIRLTYITSRGHWYHTSWKGDVQKSGGIATNIGVHFFDMLTWIFGDMVSNQVHIHTHDRACGLLELQHAEVQWFLSINPDTLPAAALESGKRTFRSILMDGEEIEFSEGFTDLHTVSYGEILKGKGYGLEETRSAITIAHDIRNAKPIGLIGDYHPFASLPLTSHPFGL